MNIDKKVIIIIMGGAWSTSALPPTYAIAMSLYPIIVLHYYIKRILGSGRKVVDVHSHMLTSGM